MERGPYRGGDQNQMCSFDRYAEAYFMAMCFISGGASEAAFFPPDINCPGVGEDPKGVPWLPPDSEK